MTIRSGRTSRNTTPTWARRTTRRRSSSRSSWRKASRNRSSPGTSEGCAAWNGAFHRATIWIPSCTARSAISTSSPIRRTRPCCCPATERAATEDTRMAKKILSILSHTEYGNLEDSDIGLFASAFAPVAGQQLTLLLREDAVNYAVRGQDGTGIKIAGTPIQPGFLIETDLRSVHGANIAVDAVREDLDERGIAPADLIDSVKLMSKKELGKLVDQFDSVWNW